MMAPMTTEVSASPLRIEQEGHVQTWTIDLPEQRNPITGLDVIEALEGAVAAANDAAQDGSLRVVILTGAGSAFSAGGNIKAMRDGEPPFGGPVPGSREGYRRGVQRIPPAMARLEVPIIAAVNGPAVGAGCDLAVMCDLRVASTRAFFAESFVQLGIIPGDGGAWFLTRLVGPARAAEMALTGDRVDAATALEWGIVNAVVEPEELLDAAHTLADRVAKNPPYAVRMAKALLTDAPDVPLRAHLESAAAMQAVAHTTQDHREAVAAFLEKRPGDFTGR